MNMINLPTEAQSLNEQMAALDLAGLTVLSADADEAVRAGMFEAARRLGWTTRSAT